MQIFRLVGSIFVDTDAANDSLRRTDRQAERTGNGFEELFRRAGSVAAGVGKVVGGMAIAAGGAMVAMTEETREYRHEMAKLQTAFGDTGFSADAAKSTYKELQSVLGETEQAVEAANHLSELCENEKELNTWTNICTGVYGKFGASIPIEGLTEAANETAKLGTLTGPLTDALNWAGVSEEKFQAQLDKCSTEQERQALITKTMNDLYSDSAEKFRENNKEIIESNKAHENLTEAMAKIGEAVEPLLTTVTEVTAGFVEGITPAIEAFCNFTAETLPLAVAWFEKYKETIIAITATLGILAAAYALYNAVQAVKAIMNAAETTSLWALVSAKLADAAATLAALGPYILIVAAIAAVIAIGVLLWKNWDTIKAKAVELWNSLKEKFENIKNSISEKISAMKNRVFQEFTNLKEGAKERVEALKQGVLDKFSSIKDGIVNKLTAARDAVKSIIDKIKSFFNIKFTLPKIKLPHFTVKPSGWELSDLLKGEIPSLGIDWYDKAMDKGMILNEPTVFGVNKNGELMAGGESGSETVVGTGSLMNMITTAVDTNNAKMQATLVAILNELKALNGGLYETIVKAMQNMGIEFDERELGRLVRRYA